MVRDNDGQPVRDYDLAIPVLLLRYFPAGMLGLGLTALLASFMSGMAGNVTAFNTVWTYDIYQAYIRPSASDAHYLLVGRMATVFGIAASVADGLRRRAIQQHHGRAAAGVRVRQRAAARDVSPRDVLEARDRPRRLFRPRRSAPPPPPCIRPDAAGRCGRRAAPTSWPAPSWPTPPRSCSPSRTSRTSSSPRPSTSPSPASPPAWPCPRQWPSPPPTPSADPLPRRAPAPLRPGRPPGAGLAVVHPGYFRAATVVVALVFAGYFVAPLARVQPYVVAFAGAAVLLVHGLRSGAVRPRIAREISWDIFPFVVGLFVVVRGVTNLGFAGAASTWLAEHARAPLPAIAAGAAGTAVAANVMNNLPAALLARGVIAGAHGGEPLVYAALLGANIGPSIVPFGSLATMLVLGVARKKGHPVSGVEVLKTGIWMTPIVLAAAAAALALSLSLWGR